MIINNELPEWAPTQLKESMRFVKESEAFWSKDLLVIESTLCTSKYMENAWQLLRDKFKDKYFFEFDAFVSEFVVQVYGAYFKREGYGADSKVEVKKKKKITRLMNELAKELDNSPYDSDALKYFSKNELKGLYTFINYGLDVDAEDSEDAFDEIEYVFLEGANFAARLVHEDIRNKIELQIDEGIKTYNVLLAPRLSDILHRCAIELEKNELVPVLSKENSTTSDGDYDLHLRWFLRVLARYFRSRFDSPNYQILADLGNSFFGGAELDEKKVGSILQDRRKKT